MTVALLAKWGDQPPGTLYTSDSTTEAAMVTAKVATANLAGAIAWVKPGSSPGSQGEPFTRTESDALRGVVSGAGTESSVRRMERTATRNIPGRPTVVAMKYNHWMHPGPGTAPGSVAGTAGLQGSSFEAWDAWPWRHFQKYPERMPLAAREMRARPFWTWNDDQSLNALLGGWLAQRAALSRVSQALRVTPTAADPNLFSPSYLGLAGDQYHTIEIKLTRVSGTSFDGVLYWITDDDTAYNGTKSVTINAPGSWVGEQTLTIPTSAVAAWRDGVIRQLRLDLSADGATVYDINSIEIIGTGSAKLRERVVGLPLNEQWAVDWELRTAYDHGVDVFSVCHFKESLTTPGKHNWYFDRLAASTVAEPIKAGIVAIYTTPYDVLFTSQANLETVAAEYASIITAMGSRYWKIDGRPVIQMFSVNEAADAMIGANFPIVYSGGLSGSNRRFALQQFVSRMRGRLQTLLGVNPYLVVQHNGSTPFWWVKTNVNVPYVGTFENAGFDATTSYVHRTGHYNHVLDGAAGGGSAQDWPPAASTLLSEQSVRSYSTMVECRDRNTDFILGQSGIGIPYWPHVTVGWARYPWAERDGVVPNPEDLNYPSFVQLRQNFAKARQYLDTYGPERTGNIVTIYAWDEYGEGGILAPTKGQGYMALEAMRDGLRL